MAGSTGSDGSTVPSFTTSGDEFMKDGAQFVLRSGEIHYWRSVPEDWESRLASVRAMPR